MSGLRAAWPKARPRGVAASRAGLLSILGLSLTLPSVAQAEGADRETADAALDAQQESRELTREERIEEAEEGLGGEEEYKNGVLFGFSHTFSFLRDRESPIGSGLPEGEHLYGFVIGYERVLHPNVAIAIIKPFYFNRERIDSELEILLMGLYRKNSWEPFLGAGIVSSLRSFETLRSTAEGKELEYAFGLHFVVGFKYFITPRWAVEFEFGYSFMPTSRIFEHEINDSYQGAYFF
jgi:hypothetical protein